MREKFIIINSTMHRITSEIITEGDNNCTQQLKGSVALTKFFFKHPPFMSEFKIPEEVKFDEDDDLDIDRGQEEGIILIEHKTLTELRHVGLQVWRGALLLADYILSNPDLFRDKVVLELGSGVGLTSIVACFVSKEVICTDIAPGGILKLIYRNFIRNISHIKCKFCVTELDFLNLNWTKSYEEKLKNVDVILAADVIYDDRITDGFVKTLIKLFQSKQDRTVYMALEKRYVFTVADMDTTAPMYEEFLHSIKRRNLDWNIDHLSIDFPRYFNYNRTKQMILIKIQNNLEIKE